MDFKKLISGYTSVIVMVSMYAWRNSDRRGMGSEKRVGVVTGG